MEPPVARRRPVNSSDGESLQSFDSISDVASNLFDSNDAGLIDNPLLHWPPAQVEVCEHIVLTTNNNQADTWPSEKHVNLPGTTD
jgi:hypothetical protein